MFLDEFPIGFARPWWLLALLLIPVILRIERVSFVSMSRRRLRWVRGLRLVIFCSLVFALAGLEIVRVSDKLTVVFLLDRSDSTRDRYDDTLRDIDSALQTMTDRDSAGLVVFGADAYVDVSPEVKARFDEMRTVVDARSTDVGAAIRLGLGLFPGDQQRRLVLASDGNENLGKALDEAAAAAASSVPIDILPVERDVAEEVLVEGVTLPESIDQDEPFDLKITVRSTTSGPATLRLFKDSQFVGSQDVELKPGKNVYVMRERGTDEGFHTYSALVESIYDTMRENNEASGYTRVFGRPQILLVGPTEDLQYLARALGGQNWEVTESHDLPLRRIDSERYDAILLVNTPSENYSNNQLALVHDYVRDLAGGFIMVGGENSYGLGGYNGTPIEDALPVSMELKNKRFFPSLALAMVIDKSGSMGAQTGRGGITKMALANQAAVAAVELLNDGDFALIVAFDSSPKRVWGLDRVGGARNDIARYVESIRPGGGTDIFPGMEAAYKDLTQVSAQLKHMIVLSDGQTHAANFQALAERCVAAKITISTVAIGADADGQLMQTIAALGGGRFYETSDPFRIPRIFTKETYIAQKAYIIEEPFVPSVFQENQIIKGITGFPDVKGYVVTEPKERAELVLLTHKGDPLLATWRYGLGKSVAFTSDAKSRWLASWVGWDGYNQFWTQMVRWVLRNQERSELHPRLELQDGKGRLVVDAVTEEGEFINFLDLAARVTLPDTARAAAARGASEVKLRQTGPGRYEAEFDARETGAYLARVYGDEDSGVVPSTAGGVISYPPEYRELQTNRLLLEQIAARTGGRYAPPVTELFPSEQRDVKRRHDLWMWFLLAAIMLFPADVAARRIFLDEEQIEALRRLARRLVPRFSARTARGDMALGTLEALKLTKQRATRRGGGASAAPTSAAGGETRDGTARPEGASIALARDANAAALESQPEAPPAPGAAPGAAPAAGASLLSAGTMDRLKKAARSGAPQPPSPPRSTEGAPTAAPPPIKPLIIPSVRSADQPPPAGGKDDPLPGLSHTERLLKARNRARDTKKKDGDEAPDS